ncbi:MAG TPA: hypothetical protein VF271_04460 [Rhodanobacteraceae bacterium]
MFTDARQVLRLDRRIISAAGTRLSLVNSLALVLILVLIISSGAG